MKSYFICLSIVDLILVAINDIKAIFVWVHMWQVVKWIVRPHRNRFGVAVVEEYKS